MKFTYALTTCLLALGLNSARAEDAKISVPGLASPAAGAKPAGVEPANPSFSEA